MAQLSTSRHQLQAGGLGHVGYVAGRIQLPGSLIHLERYDGVRIQIRDQQQLARWIDDEVLRRLATARLVSDVGERAVAELLPC